MLAFFSQRFVKLADPCLKILRSRISFRVRHVASRQAGAAPWRRIPAT